MAQFLPFRGLRYAPKTDLSAVICPPYDVIKGEARAELLQRDLHNIVAVELAAPYGETATAPQYQHSADLLSQWISEGILLRDDSSYYLYEQEFAVPGTPETLKRRGVIGALTLEEFGEGVQPHEHTLSGPKADRLNLLRATQTNISPIFGLVVDDDGWIGGLLNNVTDNAPRAQATDSDGIVHRLWPIADDEIVNGIEAGFENENILIADGHHRYETALNYMREEREKAGDNWTGAEASNSVMMMCVSMSDPGLVVLPTHRLIKNVEPNLIAALTKKLNQLFDVEPIEGGAVAASRALDNEGGQAKLVLHLPGQTYLLTQREASTNSALEKLDVSVLHDLILANELGIDADKLAAGEHVGYTIHAGEAIEKVESGAAQAAFLMRATPAKQVAEVAASGEKMPQKSTYFYPKLMTGLVLRPLN